MSKFVPLDFGHQALSPMKDDVHYISVMMMQYGLTNQWPSYSPALHIQQITSIKFMYDRIDPRLPPLDLRKKKNKVPPHNKSMPNPGLKDNSVLLLIHYDLSQHLTKDEN